VFSQIWLLFPGRFRTAWLIAAAALAVAVLGVAMHPDAPPATALTTIAPATTHEADRAQPDAEPLPAAPAPAPAPLELPPSLEKPRTLAASPAAAPPPPVSEARRVVLASAFRVADAAPAPVPDAPDVPLVALPRAPEPLVYESSSLPPPAAV